jgi:tetrahydromethanopterin S-methyltransferase subunit G
MTHPQRRAEDDFNVGELARLIASLTQTVDRLNEKIDNLATVYTPREVHDLALGGVKVDIRRLDESVGVLDKRVDEQERETSHRFRQAVTITFASLLFPLVVALVIFVLTQMVRSS